MGFHSQQWFLVIEKVCAESAPLDSSNIHKDCTIRVKKVNYVSHLMCLKSGCNFAFLAFAEYTMLIIKLYVIIFIFLNFRSEVTVVCRDMQFSRYPLDSHVCQFKLSSCKFFCFFLIWEIFLISDEITFMWQIIDIDAWKLFSSLI